MPVVSPVALLPALLLKLRAALVLWVAWISAAVSAVEAPAQRFAQPLASSATPAPAAGLAQVTFALLVVLGAIFAAAWLLRRCRTLGTAGSDPAAAIVVLAERAVGPRERVVLLQVGRERVLVGVAVGSVRALHVMSGAAADEPMRDGTRFSPQDGSR